MDFGMIELGISAVWKSFCWVEGSTHFGQVQASRRKRLSKETNWPSTSMLVVLVVLLFVRWMATRGWGAFLGRPMRWGGETADVGGDWGGEVKQRCEIRYRLGLR